MSRRWLDIENLADRWHTTPQAIHTRRHRGDLPTPIKSGKRLLWDEADVERTLKAVRALA